MSGTGLHISISAEPIASIAGLQISNSMFTSLIVSGLLIAFAFAVKASLKPANERPSGLQNVAEWIVEAIQGLVHGVTNNKVKTQVFAPLILCYFLFIVANNWFGLLPGVGTVLVPEYEKEVAEEHGEALNVVPQALASSEVSETSEAGKTLAFEEGAAKPIKMIPLLRPGTADLNTTLALAIITVFMIQFYGVKYLHLSYFKKFFDFSSPIMFFVGILELISDFSKIISFAFRLFGNVFAGEVLIAVISYLVPVVAPMAFYGLEVFVGAIQALVFSLLSLVFYNMASSGHGEEH